MAVHRQAFAEVANLVGETDLERMPGVVGILDHLGSFDVRADEWRREPRVQARQQIPARPVEFADDGLGRIEVIMHGGAFTQELGVDTNAELRTGAPARGRFEGRDYHLAHGSWQHCAANHHRRRTLMVAYGCADLLAD